MVCQKCDQLVYNYQSAYPDSTYPFCQDCVNSAYYELPDVLQKYFDVQFEQLINKIEKLEELVEQHNSDIYHLEHPG